MPVEDDAHRRLRLARQRDRDAAVVAERRLRAEAAAHAIDDHAHAAQRQAEGLRQLVPHAGGELGGHMDRQPIGAPIGDDRVRLQAAMGLHLGAKFALDDDIGLREALRDIAAAVGRRSAHIAVERQAGGAGNPEAWPAGAEALVIDQRRRRLARLIHVHDKGQRLVVDADQAQRLFGGGHGDGGDRGHGRADIAHDCGRRIARPGDDA